VEELERSQPGGGQFLPPVTASGHEDADAPDGTADDSLTRLRSDLQRLRDSVDAIDRRDAAQHGGLRGEIAHLVRRVARLEALPKVRQARWPDSRDPAERGVRGSCRGRRPGGLVAPRQDPQMDIKPYE
jgi:hypothetical protein